MLGLTLALVEIHAQLLLGDDLSALWIVLAALAGAAAVIGVGYFVAWRWYLRHWDRQ